MQEFNWFKDKRIIEAFQNSDKAYLLDIDKLRREVSYGLVTFTLRIHAGRVTDLIINKIGSRIRYDLGKQKGRR